MPRQIVRMIALRSVVFISDVTCAIFALWGAYQLRHSFQPPPAEMGWGRVLDFFSNQGIPPLLILLLLPSQSILFLIEGLTRGLWQFTSISDLIRIVKTSLMGAILLGTFVFFLRIEPVPRSIPLLYPILLIMGLGGSRLAYRWKVDHHFSLVTLGKERTHVLIIGAGPAGDAIIRDTLHYPDYHIVGLLDDDLKKQGKEIHGIRVMGIIHDLEKTLTSNPINTVFLTIDNLNC